MQIQPAILQLELEPKLVLATIESGAQGTMSKNSTDELILAITLVVRPSLFTILVRNGARRKRRRGKTSFNMD